MKPRCADQQNQALSRTDVVMIIAIIMVLSSIFIWVRLHPPSGHASQMNCTNNLRRIELAYRIWANDNNDKYPMEVSAANGGTMESISTGNVAATFLVMSNELITPKILTCPVDTNRVAATNFSGGFSVKNISYFIGLDANPNTPQAFLSGDDNFEIGDVPVKSGLLKLSPNDAIRWSATRHKHAGNITVPGRRIPGHSVDNAEFFQTDDKSLIQKLLETGLATNRLAIP